MKPLPAQFKSGGFDFEQIDRDGLIALFRKTKEGMENVCYEVVRIQECKQWVIAGNTVPAHEAMPGNEKFGVDGFAYRDKDQAKKRFSKMVGEEHHG